LWRTILVPLIVSVAVRILFDRLKLETLANLELFAAIEPGHMTSAHYAHNNFA
jgi:hypothetical protein